MKKGCLWYLFIAWWLLPIKWVYYSLPKFIIESVKQKTSPSAQTSTESAAPETERRPQPSQTTQQKVEHHKVAGTSFRMDAIQSLGIENDDYELSKRAMIDEGLICERVYKTDYYANKTDLIPEPENPHDPNAIKVVVDGVHIGYIKSGSCAHVHNLLREEKIESVKCEIKGGPYKILLEDCDEDGNETYELEKDETPVYAEVTIKIK